MKLSHFRNFLSLLFSIPIFFLTLFSAASLSAQANPPVPRGTPGDLWADKILGQADNGIPNYAFGQGSLAPGEPVSFRIGGSSGAVCDTLHNILYNWDVGNNRIMGVNLATLPPGKGVGIGAQIVLGQPDFNHTGENGDSNWQNFPTWPAPSASTLGSLWFFEHSIEGGSTANMAVDPQGNLYVPDYYNNRVLRYDWPITSGQAASHVWGQPDFSSYWYNQTPPNNNNFDGAYYAGTPFPPTASTLGFFQGAAGGAGVAIDPWGNLWVADSTNNRVVRFPADPANNNIPKTSADVVLGQTNFTSNNGQGLGPQSAVNSPGSVRVDVQGNVYVGVGPVLVFRPTPNPTPGGQPTYTNGQPYVLSYNQYVGNAIGLEWDAPVTAGGTGGLWVTDFSNNQLVLLQFDYSSAPNQTDPPVVTPIKVLGHDLPSNGTVGNACAGGTGVGGNGVVVGDQNTTFTDGSGLDSTHTFLVCNPTGGVGVDASGNVYACPNEGLADLWRYPAPIPTPVAGTAHDANLMVYNPAQFNAGNYYGNVGFVSPAGVAVAPAGGVTQIIVGDHLRLHYWNMPAGGPSGLTNGNPETGYAGASQPYLYVGNTYGRIKNDRVGHLFAVQGNNTIEVFNLPLTNGAVAAQTLPATLPLLGGGNVSFNFRVDGIAVDPTGTYLWASDTINSRIFRIRNPLTSPVVDIILGQPNATATGCDGNGTYTPYAGPNGCGCTGGTVTRYVMNVPGAVVLDHNGDLFVSDYSLETQGNGRMLRWDASTLATAAAQANATGVVQFGNPGIPPDGLFGRTSFNTLTANIPSSGEAVQGPFEPAFNSDDSRMVVGMNGQGGFRFPVVFQNPRLGDTPIGKLQDYGPISYSETFDDADNLYVVESNRNRVMIYYKPFDITETPTPSITPTVVPCAQISSLSVAQPYGIALDNSGNAYVADDSTNLLDVFNSSGVPQAPIGTGILAQPMGVAVNGTNLIYVTDMEQNQVDVFNQQGQSVGNWGAVGGIYGGIEIGQFLAPAGIAVNSAATTVVVVDQVNQRVEVFSQAVGPLLNVSGSTNISTLNGTFVEPVGVALDSAGNAYVADFGTNLLQVFNTSTGNPITQWDVTQGTSLQAAEFVAVGPNGLVYVSDDQGAVGIFDVNGIVQGVISGGTIPFNGVEGIAFGNGSMYVADLENAKVDQFPICPVNIPIFTPTPTFTPVCVYGDTNVEGTGLPPGYLSAASITLTSPGAISTINLYINTSGTTHANVALYDSDLSGNITTMLAQSGSQVVTSGWNALTIPTQSVSAKVYWLAFQYDNGSSVYGSGSIFKYVQIAQGYGGWPSMAGTGPNNPINASIYANICSSVPSNTPTMIATYSPTPLPTWTPTPNPTNVPTSSPTATLTPSNTPTLSPILSPTPTFTACCQVAATTTAGPGGNFNLPCGMAVKGNVLYVADFGNNQVQELQIPSLAPVAGGIIPTLAQPYALALDQQGYLYVGFWGGSTIQKFDTTGALKATLSTAGLPLGVCVDSNGDIYVSEAETSGTGQVQIFPWNGSGYGTPVVVPLPGSSGGMRGIVKNGNRLYVADYNNSLIYELDETGSYNFGAPQVVEGPGVLQNPTQLILDANGNIIVCSTGNGTLIKYTVQSVPDATLLIDHYCPFAGAPQDVAEDAQGNVYAGPTSGNYYVGIIPPCAVPPTSTPTFNGTPTFSPTLTPTTTPTPSLTNTPTLTPTNSATQTPTNSPTLTSTNSATLTPTNTPLPTSTNSATNTPTNSPTQTMTNTAPPTITNTFSNTPTNSTTTTPTNSPTQTITNTFSKTPTNSATTTPTNSSTQTMTNSVTKTATNSPTKTPTLSPTNSPSKTATNTPTGSFTPTFTKTATKTPTLTVTKTVTKTATNSPTKTSTLTPTKTITNTATKTLTKTPTRTPTSTPTKTPTPGGNCSGVAAWSSNSVHYVIGNLVTYPVSSVNHLFKCIQAHTSQPSWDPVDATSLWQDQGACTGGSEKPLNGLTSGDVGASHLTVTPTTLLLSRKVLVEPNISKGGTPIKFAVRLSGSAEIHLILVTLLGEKVYQTRLQGNPGENDILWTLQNLNGSQVASGLYIYMIEVDSGNGTENSWGKVVVIR